MVAVFETSDGREILFMRIIKGSTSVYKINNQVMEIMFYTILIDYTETSKVITLILGSIKNQC